MLQLELLCSTWNGELGSPEGEGSGQHGESPGAVAVGAESQSSGLRLESPGEQPSRGRWSRAVADMWIVSWLETGMGEAVLELTLEQLNLGADWKLEAGTLVGLASDLCASINPYLLIITFFLTHLCAISKFSNHTFISSSKSFMFKKLKSDRPRKEYKQSRKELKQGIRTTRGCHEMTLVTKMINEGRAVDVGYTDFSKAYYKVPHGRLSQKIK
eukprot:g45606.t1